MPATYASIPLPEGRVLARRMPPAGPQYASSQHPCATVVGMQVLLLGLPASRQTPLQNLLRRAGYAVLSAPNPRTVPTWMSAQDVPAYLLVLADGAVAGDALARLLAVLRAAIDRVTLIRLTSMQDAQGSDQACLDLEAELIQLPAAPGQILQALARARSGWADDGEERP